MSYEEYELMSQYGELPLESKAYHQFQGHSESQEIVVIIGGETHGISNQAKRLALTTNGERLFIPLKSPIDSLNVSSAASVILFHIQKELMNK